MGPHPARRRPHLSRLRRDRIWAALFLLGLLATACTYRRTDVAPVIPQMSESSRIYAADGTLLTVLHAEQNRELATFEQFPEVLVDAVVAIEDKRFWEHNGVDLQAVLRAAKANAETGGIAEGGSTITQQYVKNALLDPSQTVNRKLREMSLAWEMERNFSKELILELYLNTIYFGHGAYGVQAAAQTYFGLPVSELDLPRAALLAGLIQSPSATDPYVAPDLALARRNVVLQQMLLDGRITVPEEINARTTPITLRPEFTAADRFPAAHFVEEVKQFILTDPRFGETEEARRNLLFGGGLRIQTTIDLGLQALGERAIAEILPDPATDPDAALVCLDVNTGKVLAMVGGRDYFGSSPYAKVNLAMGSGRQAGSTFKTIVLSAALERGVSSLGKVYKAPPEMEFKLDNGDKWTVRNYGGSGGGMANLLEATIRSYNTVYAQLMTEVTPDAAVATAHALGIVSPLAPVPAAVLGTENVTVLEMANAYGTIANRGVHVAPVFVSLITDATGTVLYEAPRDLARAVEEDTADQVTYALQQVVSRGTGTGAQIGRPVAGKTGTAEEYRDAWFVGFTPQLVTAVWVGFPQEQLPMVPPNTPITVTGGAWPASIWNAFMSEATAGLERSDFKAPSAKVLAYSASTTSTIDTTTTTARVGGSSTTAGNPGSGTSTTRPPATTMPPNPTTAVTGPPPVTTTEPPAETAGDAAATSG